MALALAISKSPSEIEPLRRLARPRPYSDDVNLGLILRAASKSAIAFFVCPLFRLTRPRLSRASTKFGRSRSASLQSFNAACRSPITVRVQQRLLKASTSLGFSRREASTALWAAGLSITGFSGGGILSSTCFGGGGSTGSTRGNGGGSGAGLGSAATEPGGLVPEPEPGINEKSSANEDEIH